MSVLRASQLTHSFGDILIFDGCDLQLDRGWTGVVGENGRGKTPLLRMISGDLSPDGGSIAVDGRVLLVPQSVELITDAIVAFAEGDGYALRGRLDLDPAMLERWPTLSTGDGNCGRSARRCTSSGTRCCSTSRPIISIPRLARCS